MYKVIFQNDTVRILKNVAPANWKELWDDAVIATSLDEIPQEILTVLGEDMIDQIAWFFEDLKMEEYPKNLLDKTRKEVKSKIRDAIAEKTERTHFQVIGGYCIVGILALVCILGIILLIYKGN